MSSQAYIFNPTERTSAAAGDGFSAPRLTTTDRNALSLGVNGKGMMVYDTTLNNLFIWNGSAWESVPSSGDAGADGTVQYNDNGIVTGATNFIYDKATGNVGVGIVPVVPNGGCLQLKSGITFPIAPVPSSDVNTLDDYKEGTWNPVATGLTAVGAVTYTAAYTKIGRVVYINLKISAVTSTTSVSGTTFFSGLPFVPAQNSTMSAVNELTFTSVGVGLISTGSIVYTSNWTAVQNVTLSGFYYV